MNFSSETLSGIFIGKIKKWNDPEIAVLNPSPRLPGSHYVVVGHAGEDGSTYALSDFLSKTNVEWRQTVGKVRAVLAPPVLVRAQTEDDIASLVKQTPNSVSYVELWAARNHKLSIGRVRNRAGGFIEPTVDFLSAAAGTAAPELLSDVRASITDSSGRADYPICSLTWIVLSEAIPDSEKKGLVLSFVQWVLTSGQSAPATMFYGHLPRTVLARELHVIESLR